MKKLFLITLIIFNISYAEETNECKKHIENIESNDSLFLMDNLTISAIDEIDLAHQFSSLSSKSKGLSYLAFDNLDKCKPEDRKRLRHYWSLVSLFTIHDGEVLVDEESIKVENKEMKEIEEITGEQFYFPTQNVQKTTENLKAILQFYNKNISTVNIKKLANKIKKFRNGAEYVGTTLYKISEKMRNIIHELKESKEIATATYLFSIAKSKKFYNHPSWLAMNFYNKQKEEIDLQDISKSRTYIESELITDLDSNISYKYFMSNKGIFNDIDDINKSLAYHYFLSEDGVKSPSKEMKATLHYFFDNNVTREQRSCKEYYNRYVLLKQLFRKIQEFPQINCSHIENQFEYGYFTTGKNSDESFGHSILHVITTDKNRKKRTIIKSNQKFLANVSFQPIQYKEKRLNDNDILDNNSTESINDYYINFALNEPKNMNFFDKIKYDFNGIVGNSNGQFTKADQLAIGDNYRGRMLVLFPIKELTTDRDKQELFSAHIQHILRNKNNFRMPYYFASKNCAYVIENLLEVPFPELRKKFNDTGYFSFSPKDVIFLLKGKIDVSKHKANHI